MNKRRETGLGNLLFEDDRISAVGDVADSTKADEVVECEGRLVIPGLVQPHTHLCQTLFRGAADELELLDWLRERIWPFEAAHSFESLSASATLGIVELLRTGTTAILDMGTVHHTEAIFKACKKLGIRATVGKAMMDMGQGVPPALKETTDASLEDSLSLADRWHQTENGRLRYAFAPRFVLSCSEALMHRVVKEARDRELMIHTHSSENAEELQAVRDCFGMSNVAYLHSLGAISENTVLAHCVWVSTEERKILAETGAHVAHCPSANLKLASGICKVPELLESGISVGIAADGAPCNNNLDAFMEMRLAALIQKPRLGPRALPAEKVFEMATLGGARALGLEGDIGSLEVGKKADIAVVRTEQAHIAPSNDPYSTLVYAAHGHDVEHVFVDGRKVVKRGRVVGVNESRAVHKARGFASQIVDQVLH